MNDWSMLKKLIWLHIVKGGGGIERTVKGAIVHVTNALALPAEALTVNVEPIQAGSGDPSPDNVRPISGRTSATVTRTGKNLLNPANYVFNERTQSGLTYTVQADGSIHVTGTATSTGGPGLTGNIEIPNGTYTWSNLSGSENVYFVVRKRDKVSGVTSSLDPPFTADGTFFIYVNLYCKAVGTYDMTIYPQLELGSIASAYEPYQGNTYAIALGDTVYGGTLNVTQGKMLVDRAELVPTALKQGAYVTGERFYPWITLPFPSVNYSQGFCNKLKCARTLSQLLANVSFMVRQDFLALNLSGAGYESAADAIAAGNAFIANNDAQFVYQLATPFEITLTPTQIDMLLGENNLWADAGDSTLTYYAEGEASTSEALGILLGGTYNNPGGADDVSDDEALGILLGGS